MEREYIKAVIEEIKQNPEIHYDELSLRFPDEEGGQLFRLLYGLCERIILTKKEKLKLGLYRGIEKGMYSLNKKNYRENKLNDCVLFWKL